MIAQNVATLDFNNGNGKWEASFNGQVILSSQNKEYVIEKIVNQVSNKVKAAGVTDFIDISEYDNEMRAALIAGNAPAIPDVPALTFSINERFEFVEDFVEMVGNRQNASAIITGSGGLGKSYTTMKTLREKCGLSEHDLTSETADVSEKPEDADSDDWEASRAAAKALVAEQKNTFVQIKGFTTPKGLFRKLYENRNRIIIVDDCDEAIMHPVCQNLLKSALDSYEDRIVTWNAEQPFGSDLPRSFRFTGGVIIITNKSMTQVPQALLSRSLNADVSMTRDETVDRMRLIAAAPEFMPETSNEVKTMALDFIAENINRREVGDVNMRTLISVIKIASSNSSNWKRSALYTMVSTQV